MCGGMLLSLTPVISTAQALCEELGFKQRSYAEQLLDDAALHADAGEVDLQAYGESRLQGGVRMRFGRDILFADDVRYRHADRQLRVIGRTLFETETIQVQAEAADIDLDSEEADFEQARYVAFAAGARGHAEQLHVSGSQKARLRGVRYTTCSPEQEAWVLESDEITLDSKRGLGSARNAKLRFMGVPIFWAPLFYFPVGDQRQTGVLPPRIGDNATTGLDISIPLYINLAPNYDLTLTPRHMSERGEQIAATGRYLFGHSEGDSTVEWLEEDEQTGERRYLLDTTLEGGTAEHWSWQVAYTRVSDESYASELDTTFTDAAQSQLPQYARLSYRHLDAGLRASLAAHEYQSLIRTLEEPYARLPEFNLNWQPAYRNGRVRPFLSAQAVNFRDIDETQTWREDARIGLDWRLDLPQAFFTAHTDYRWTGYQAREDGTTVDTIDRHLGTVQTGFGLNFVRQGRFGRYQTLTPQVYYLYVPYTEQDAIPLFDTSQPDFSFDQLFALNRFTGVDRIADANLITTAVRTDWYRDFGRERVVSAKLGVQWRAESSQVTLPGESAPASGSSDWLGEIDYMLNDRLRAQLVGQWNADENRMDQSSVAARYQYSEDQFIHIAYRFRRDNFEQTDAIVSMPINSRWKVAGRWTYSLEDHRSLEALGGLEYSSCCWGAQIAWRRYLAGDGGRFDSSIYLQLELNGLGRIGEGLDRLLTRDIL